MLQPVVRRTLAPRGQTPILECWDRHDRLSVISGLTVAPQRRRIGLHFDIHSHNIRADDVYRFVQAVRHRLRRKIILVLDRWSVHRAAIRQLLERHARNIDIELLPAYAPELNPTEQVWNHTKYADLANYIPDDIHDLGVEVAGSMLETRSTPTLLRSFFNWAGLDL
jgi:DDE superfamily endonuclease